MVKLAEYPRTATFAWSHDRSPLLATGTASGTIDADFSSDSKLEIWSLLSADASAPQASVVAEAKFNDLDWSHDNQVVAGALENGTVEFFSPQHLKSIAKVASHTTPVKTVRFNAKQHNVMCSGGGNREIFIWDVSKVGQAGYAPVTPGTAMTPMDEIHSLAWNQSQSHVFASAGSSGFASIWDLKAKKEVLHLSHASQVTGQKTQLSIVEWHPSNSTRIATASGSDSDSSILVWDLRNANVPLSILSGSHSAGILSLDWCKQDEKLMLSSGRDNTCVLWNPEEAQKLTQFPTRGNWCFKTKFAPQAPDLFASASFDNKIEVQTLQNLTCDLDENVSANKQQESEAEFWNNVSEQDSNEKPVVSKLQAPAWYGNKSPAAQWAFGGKLVFITNDKKGVRIVKPTIPGVEKNVMLDEALQSKNFKPIINKRLVQSIDETNEEDWNMLERLSLDGKEAFLKEALAFDDEDTDASSEKPASADDNDDFFTNLNQSYTPEGSFKLETTGDSDELIKSLIQGDKKKAITQALDQELLLESLIIALECDDQNLKQKVKNAYFSKHGGKSSLARVLHSVSESNVDDLVDNLDVTQWKYALKAINAYTPDLAMRNELLIKLGDRVSESKNRQDALLLYLSAQSLDKVAEIWLKEFMVLESKLKSKKETIYEAHLECLTEFVERFTVFISLISDEQHQKIANEGLISKFLEFVNLTSANGDFDLALKFLDILPGDNEEVITEKQRVMIASGKVPSATKNVSTAAPKIPKSRYAASSTIPAGNAVGLGVSQTQPPAGGPQQIGNNFAPGPSYSQAAPLTPRAASMTAPITTALKSSSYMPAMNAQVPAASKYGLPTAASPSGITRVPTAVVPPQPLNNVAAVNPYTPAGMQAPVANAPVNPYANRYGSVGTQPTYTQPLKPVANVIGAGSPGFNNGMQNIPPPPITGVSSGQTPHLNRKANDGWNDLPLKNVQDKPTRAKAVSVAPASVVTSPGPTGPQSNFGSIPPPPLSRVTSSATIQTPVPHRIPSKTYAPSNSSASPTAAAVSSPAPSLVPGFAPPSNPYAPPPATNFPLTPYASSPKMGPASTHAAYAPSNSMPLGGGPVLNGQNSQPPASQKTPVAPPPKNMRRKTHATQDVNSANALLQSVQGKPETSVPQATSLQTDGSALGSAVANGTQTPDHAQTGAAAVAVPAESQEIPLEQQPIVDFLTSELARVTPLIPQEYTKQLKDCNKRLHILFGHLKRQDLLTQPTIDRLHQIVALMQEHRYAEAMQVHVDIATNYAQDAGNWLTGMKRLIGIAEVTSS
ncbi:LAME_0B06238g1_1 [Lachancea meyersii CBS 8951]|uniref:Protein transport protein SEC31 n=1 Tax=Lachancea meyersii CBS 8951 TaxID=1266667 RepID=A0A1G4IWM3_9SACH|nr:LAME_0B06238g1_1 [Lachancea meyersii CBS 8951]